MNTHRQNATVFLFLLAAGTASCDIPASMPEMPAATAVPAATFQEPPDRGDPVGDSTHRFQFDIGLMDEGALRLRNRIFAQADRWVRIVHGSDLADIEWGPGTVSCGGLHYDYQQDVVDDVIVMVSVQDYFTGSPTGVGVRICGSRASSSLPVFGAIFLDIEGVDEGHVDDMILHSFGHMLGFGFSWGDRDLLRNSSWSNEGADTHFTGSGAIAAFVAAGGANYPNSKVPVENYWTNGTVDYHWRKAVFGTELMAPWLDKQVADPLSVITIQSLADLGYTVDLELADSYRVPDSHPPRADGHDGSASELSCDFIDGPVALYGPDGRVVRVLRN